MKVHLTACFCLLIAAMLPGETFLLLAGETRNGETGPQFYRSREGLLDAFYEAGHISFDMPFDGNNGDWDLPHFAEPILIARGGGARYLAAAQITTDLSLSEEEFHIEGQARFALWDVEKKEMVDQGTFSIDEQGEKIDYEQTQYRIGWQLGQELIRIWVDNH
ncbi:MAG TPA: hypothetical protein ENI27_08780 [bacterium]|nr:hypothetical protein [bacterium]